MQYISKDTPSFNRRARRISGGYAPGYAGSVYDTPGQLIDDTSMDEVVAWANIVDAIDSIIIDVNTKIDEQTANMMIPVNPEEYPSVAEAAKFMSNGDHNNYIDQNDWKKSLFATDNAMINIPKEYDLMEMLWAELRIKISEWLADKVDDIPVIGEELADSLRKDAEAAASDTFKAMNDTLTGPASIPELTKGLPASVKGLIHGKAIQTYIHNYLSNPGPTTFNPMAVDVKPIVDSMATTWSNTNAIVSKTYGIPVLPDVEVTTIPGKTNMGEWVQSEGRDIISPALDGYRYIRGEVITEDFWKYGVDRSRSFFNGVNNALSAYTKGTDLACCLLDNILGLHSISPNTLNLLRMLRLGLRYSFNGLNIDSGSLLNILSDILNRAISIAMGKVITALEEILDDKIVKVRNYFQDFSGNKGEAWRRCYPFDELMTFALNALTDMEHDILGYIQDYTNMMKLSHVNLNKYMANIKKREYARSMVGILDTLIGGIETGIICKDLSDIDVEYTRPTPEELTRFISDLAFRSNTNVDEAVNKYMRAPSSGIPIVPNATYVGNDLQWMQNCDKSLTKSEVSELEAGLRRIGII